MRFTPRSGQAPGRSSCRVPKLSRALRRSTVGPKQPSNSLLAPDLDPSTRVSGVRRNETNSEPPMVPLVVLGVFANEMPKASLSEWNDLGQVLRLSRTYETLRVRVEVRAVARRVRDQAPAVSTGPPRGSSGDPTSTISRSPRPRSCRSRGRGSKARPTSRPSIRRRPSRSRSCWERPSSSGALRARAPGRPRLPART